MDEDSSTQHASCTDENTVEEESSSPFHAGASAEPAPSHGSLKGMNLEQIIEITGEFSHLNELVMVHIEHAGGFKGADGYFRIVQPILDLLEVEIRVRCTVGITPQQMKLIVQDWIDQEIKACTSQTPDQGQ